MPAFVDALQRALAGHDGRAADVDPGRRGADPARAGAGGQRGVPPRRSRGRVLAAAGVAALVVGLFAGFAAQRLIDHRAHDPDRPTPSRSPCPRAGPRPSTPSRGCRPAATVDEPSVSAGTREGWNAERRPRGGRLHRAAARAEPCRTRCPGTPSARTRARPRCPTRHRATSPITVVFTGCADGGVTDRAGRAGRTPTGCCGCRSGPPTWASPTTCSTRSGRPSCEGRSAGPDAADDRDHQVAHAGQVLLAAGDRDLRLGLARAADVHPGEEAEAAVAVVDVAELQRVVGAPDQLEVLASVVARSSSIVLLDDVRDRLVLRLTPARRAGRRCCSGCWAPCTSPRWTTGSPRLHPAGAGKTKRVGADADRHVAQRPDPARAPAAVGSALQGRRRIDRGRWGPAPLTGLGAPVVTGSARA